MKKTIFFLVFIVLTHGVAAHEQLYHYTYDYTITRDGTTEIWLSKNRKQLVFPSEYATLVFKRIPKRTITQHVPMCPVIKKQPINRPL